MLPFIHFVTAPFPKKPAGFFGAFYALLRSFTHLLGDCSFFPKNLRFFGSPFQALIKGLPLIFLINIAPLWVLPLQGTYFGGLKWTRTTDLTLIRRAL